ncbi:winged helix-turn-helix domain-containing protein [Escherichia coli]
MFREDEPMPLTSGEFAVLKALVSHPREPLSRDKLMNLAVVGISAMERSIDVQISRLRRMVEEIERIRVTSFRPSGSGLRLLTGRLKA